ncbi:type II toxin-antitoxin system RelE/ParE family toxin [Adhaeretor mobilis]|uniref:Type II toxin-antitoxin system RelE/ParE family toxin n=1 Tax=Adhaeretor mobilis TaxID=1930276 RepID=A0A517N2H0_9BACT|nr:type II toxin-antitoxin system RelE/ParE family toxin [Adhaeretor mobilis]QDT01325.1 hypothetical protein HG15A2_46670 [Adhaeretor mobilis]
MPQTELIFYQDENGTVPVRDWLQELESKDIVAADKCVAKLGLLSERGHELRRPHVDMLRDGIFELRIRHGNVNYRILYFFHGKNVAILAHGLTKEAKVPKQDIERALERKTAFVKDAKRHSYQEDNNNG